MKRLNVLAQRVGRTGQSAFIFTLAIDQALDLLEIPDPAHPFPDNRRVSRKHAMDFGRYWEQNEVSWVIPPLLLDSPLTFAYSEIPLDRELGLRLKNNGLAGLVELQLVGNGRESLRILDGQHRILGWYLKRLELDSRMAGATSEYNRHTLRNDKESANLSLLEIEHVKRVNERFKNEHVAVNLLDSLDSERHQQFFVDIAKNALGINKTVQSKFDTSSVINRVTQRLIAEHPLLSNRVDLEKTSCSGSNPNLLTVVNIADITRHACFGIRSRVTAKKENNYSDQDLFDNLEIFFDAITNQMPQLQELSRGKVLAQGIREKYLLGSGTIWRGLAGAFYETCVITDDDLGTIERDYSQLAKFEVLLGQLSENMELPISRNWFHTDLFPSKTSKAPSSRVQDLSAMADLLTAWAQSGQMFNPRNCDWI